MSSALRTVLLVGVFTVLGGCEDPLTPTEKVIGDYVATTLVDTQGSSTIDLLAQSAEIEVTLQADGTTSGRLFVPGGAADGGDLDVDLTGSWLVVNGTRVLFNHPGSSFLRNRLFDIGDGQLRSDQDGIEVVLTQL